MAIRSFELGPLRGLVKARADELPNLVAIAGPNGAGKSALLEMLWTNRNSILEPGTSALYVGPHRTWRGSQLTDAAVRSMTSDFEEILKQDSLPGFQVPVGGLHWLTGLSRIGSSADDAQALVKAAIVRIHNKVQAVVTKEFFKQGNQIAAESVPDLLGPLKDLIGTLLPHLRWQGIDETNAGNIRVLFKTSEMADADESFDIDGLSSGEKAAIALFLPVVERQVRALVEDQEFTEGLVPLTFLIDEPEIHLHPLLQLNMLAYMRDLAIRNEVQFIFATHSPALLDDLDPGELFQVNPDGLSPENQFVRLSDTREHLEAARRITGSTHLLTRSKPIVFIEGEPDIGAASTDERLMKLLVPEAQHWALVASHGKSQVIKAVRDMRATQLNLPGFPVFGIVDSDQGAGDALDTVVSWPVSMVENLLLDAVAIHAVLAPHGGHQLTSVDKMKAALDEAAAAVRDDEVRIRIESALPKSYVRLEGCDIERLEARVGELFNDYLVRVRKVDVAKVQADAELEVATIEKDGAMLERFRGKAVLRKFYDENSISALGLGWNAFVLQVANEAARGERCRKLTEPTVRKIQLYFPKSVVETVRASGDLIPDTMLQTAERHRGLWDEGKPEIDGRETLRRQLIEHARTIRDAGDEAAASALLEAAVGIRLGD